MSDVCNSQEIGSEINLIIKVIDQTTFGVEVLEEKIEFDISFQFEKNDIVVIG